MILAAIPALAIISLLVPDLCCRILMKRSIVERIRTEYRIGEKKMKEIKLIPDAPFYNSVDVHVMDFPHGRDGEERQRCKITVEFAKTDVDDLRKRGMGLTEAMEYYRGWIYDIVKVHISQDWECISGMEETLAIVEERVKTFF